MTEEKTGPDPKKAREDIEVRTGSPSECEKDTEECAHSATQIRGGETMEDCLGRSLETLSKAFSASARRWESIVYPSLFAFILLAAYGFYLIYSLTKDVHNISGHITTITTNMQDITTGMNTVAKNMVLMTQTTDAQALSMKDMVVSMHHMSVSMGQMRYDLSVMNNSVSRPMQFMNTFMPW